MVGARSMAWQYCRASGAAVGDSPGPVHHQRIGHAAFVHLALPAAEGGVAGDGPTPGVVVVDGGPTDVVEVVQLLFERGPQYVPRSGIVVGTTRSALGAGAVVAQHHHQGVVEVVDAVEEVDDATHLLVGVAEHGGEGLHVAGVHALLILAERVPGRHPLGSGAQLGGGRQEPGLGLAAEHLVAPLIPPLVEAAAVVLEPRGRGMVRGVTGARGEVAEERLRRLAVAQIGDELDHAVGQVLGEVVAVVVAARRRHLVVVVEQRRGELMRLTVEEAVVALEPPAQRPGGAGGAQVLLVVAV